MRPDMSCILKETLILFDNLASYDSEMKKIFNDDMREYIRNRGVENVLKDYYNRLLMITDMLSIYDRNVASNMQSVEFIDEVPRMNYISKLSDKTIRYDTSEIVKNKHFFSKIGQEYLDFSTQDSRRVTWHKSLCDEDKIELFSMDWSNEILDVYEDTQQKHYWEFCEKVLMGYFGYLIWGGMTFFEERQMLPKYTERAYAKRTIYFARMLTMSPDCWFFCKNALKVVSRHAEYLFKCTVDNDTDEVYVILGLLHAAILLNHDKYKIEAKRRHVHLKDIKCDHELLKEVETFYLKYPTFQY